MDLSIFSRFVFVGFLNTVLGISVIFIARQTVSDVAANLLSYLIVVPISFLMHRKLSFRDGGAKLKAFCRYLPTIFVGYWANYFVLTTLLDGGTDPYLSQIAALATHVIVTFALSRWFVFLGTSEHPPFQESA